jgi:hypothetical protein
VIRRAFWLSVGAAAGIAGYRRVSAVGRAGQVRVNGATQPSAVQPSATPPAAVPAGPGPFWPPRPVGSASPDAPHTRFTEGRAQVSPVTRGPAVPVTWSATRTAWRTSRAAWKAQKAAVSGVRSAGRFARDVREGMDVYMSRQDD